MMGVQPSPTRLDRIYRMLPAEDAAWLRWQLTRPQQRRKWIRNGRNAAIRALLPFCPGPNAAAAIAAALKRFRDEWWTRDGGLRPLGPDASAQDQALHKVLRLNGCRVLKCRRIHDVLKEG